MSLYPKSFSVVELFCTIPVSGGLRDVLRAVQVSVILSEERSGRRLIEDKRNIVIGRKVRGIAVDLVVFQDKVHSAGARDKIQDAFPLNSFKVAPYRKLEFRTLPMPVQLA